MTTIPDSSCSNVIDYKGFNVQITNYGKSVLIVKGNQEFKVILNEQDASKENQQYIKIQTEDIIQDEQSKLTYVCDSKQNIKTKVLCFQKQQGIAIKWSTGLQSTFIFKIDE
ncbi:unnamed protein product [Paramecium primaurelia]|uniref:Uncharacterized protein n=1 Tax=Paramecium primaurelia TaxID=5886 RepID=A0A8S1PZ40_PARPR|nr:unnamed protein product [Paramecium primaurelia]